MKRLTADQRARVEKLATEEGTTCEGCGRAGLRRGEEALRTHNHGLMVYLWCASDVHPRGPTNTSRSPPGRTSAPRGESYAPECLEGMFSEAGVFRTSHRFPLLEMLNVLD
jgi:hypothetical protein